MANEGVREWDGTAVVPGQVLILLEVPATSASSAARIVAGSGGGTPVTFCASLLPAFLLVHRHAFFVSPDSAPLVTAAALFPDAAQPEATILTTVLEADCWVDLGLLDLLLRTVTSNSVCRPRAEEELVGEARLNAAGAGENRSQIPTNSYQNLPFRDRIANLLAVADQLAERAEALADEVERPHEAEYRLRSLSPDAALTNAGTVHSSLAAHAADYLRRRTLGAAHPPASGGSDSLTGPVEGLPNQVLNGATFCGIGTALRGTLALVAMPCLSHDGSRIVSARLDDLRAAAEDRYRDASRELRRHPEAHTAFRWEGETVSRDRNRVDTTEALRGWLRVAGKRLVDRWGLPVAIPETATGELTQNAEHWGCWAACDGALWAWRELVRMAEVIRFATATATIAPRYDVAPRLRSMEPNLDVYRRLGIPVLRPHSKHVFLAGRVRDLRLRCFAAVGLSRGYFHRGTSRLAGYFFGADEPVAAIAAELYAGDAVREARAACPPPAVQGEDEDGDKEDGVDLGSVRDAALERYAALQQTQPLLAESWQRRAEGLLNAAIVGIPDARLGTFLACEYHEPNFDSLDAVRMLNLLASDVVYELQPCLEDRSADTIWARLGRSSQDELYRRLSSEHPDTFAAWARNRVSGAAGVEGLNLGSDAYPTPDSGGAHPTRGRRPDLYLSRGRTLGGRFTAMASRPLVLQQEVLLTADEVMLEVAHALQARGYKSLGIAGEEFLVEVPDRGAQAAQAAVEEACAAGAARLLGNLASVSVDPCEFW